MTEIHPIVIVRFDRDSFGAYLEEILIAEGFPYVESTNTPLELTAETHPIVILPHGRPESSVIEHLLSQVEDGAVLFAVRPSKEMREILQIEVRDVVPAGYLSWNTSSPIQVHTQTDIYKQSEEWNPLASFQRKRGEDMGPGIVSKRIGRGTATIFSFDLPESIVLTRQGNPKWIDSKGDEFPGLRPGDLFYRTTGESWIDARNAHLPQADLLQRFLVELILRQSPIPLPRTWYFPRMQKTSVTIVADSDSATPEDVEIETCLVAKHGGVYSLYLIDKTMGLMTRNDALDLLRRGDEISIHPNYGKVGDTSRPERDKVRLLYVDMVRSLETKFGMRPATMRHHSLVWSGWVDVPRIQEEFGVLLDNCYGYPPWFGQARFRGCEVGYITGSGQPQRFCDLNGQLVEVYQLEQNFEDEILLPDVGLGLSGEEAAQRLSDFVEASQEGNHSHIVACFHPIRVATEPEGYRALEGLLSYCNRRGVPIRTLREVAEFANLRRQISFTEFRREGHALSFQISGPVEVTERGVTIILPADRIHRIEIDGTPVSWPRVLLNGKEHLYNTPDRVPTKLRVS